MVGDVVYCEPVSASNDLFCRENTGNFIIFGIKYVKIPAIYHEITVCYK